MKYGRKDSKDGNDVADVLPEVFCMIESERNAQDHKQRNGALIGEYRKCHSQYSTKKRNVTGVGVFPLKKTTDRLDGNYIEKNGKHKAAFFNEHEIFNNIDVGNGCKGQQNADVFRQTVTGKQLLIEPDGNAQKQQGKAG